MLSKQAPELSLADTQALGKAIDTRFIEGACVDQRQCAGHRIRRPAPGGKLGRRFRPTAQAGTEARFLRRRCGRIKRHVLALGHARRADRTAIDPCCLHPAEQPPVEARVTSAERAITRVDVEIHGPSLLRARGMSSGFRTSPTGGSRTERAKNIAEPDPLSPLRTGLSLSDDASAEIFRSTRENLRNSAVPRGNRFAVCLL
jgi:hypothetical protein